MSVYREMGWGMGKKSRVDLLQPIVLHHHCLYIAVSPPPWAVRPPVCTLAHRTTALYKNVLCSAIHPSSTDPSSGLHGSARVAVRYVTSAYQTDTRSSQNIYKSNFRKHSVRGGASERAHQVACMRHLRT